MTNSTPTTESPPIDLRRSSNRIGEKIIVGWLFIAAAFSVLVTIAIVLALFIPTIEFFGGKDGVFEGVSPVEFFQIGTWAPRQGEFNVGNLVIGTLNVTFYALLIGIPAGIGTALWLSEYASDRTRQTLKPIIEILEGVPTVAYGLFAFLFVTPVLIDLWPTWLPGSLGEPPPLFNAASASIVMGIMLIPTIATISEDAMRSVPDGLRQAAYGIGSTRMQTAIKVIIPSAFSGIMAGVVLGISRGIGETMLVLMAAGATPNATMFPNESVQTMTAYIARTATGDISQGTIDYVSIFAVGSLLFVITLIMNLISFYLVSRFRETYE